MAMPKKAKERSAIEVSRLTAPGLWSVGGVAGLHLQVLPTGARSWVLRVVVGFSVKVWIEMTYRPDGNPDRLPAVMIVKAGFGRFQAINEFAYRAEMRSYRDVLPRFALNAPQCYYAGESPDGRSTAVIIEDLTPKRVRFCHALTPLDFDAAAGFLEALARFHAQTWNRPFLSDGSYPWAVDQATAAAGLVAYQEDLLSEPSWRRFMALPRCAAIPRLFHDRERFLSAFNRALARGGQQAQVILVGDTHLGNLYIEADGRPGFLDFLGRIAPWSQEVAYFLGAALDVPDRRAWDRRLIELYLRELGRSGVSAPSFDAAWRSYREQLIFPLNTWILNGSEFQTESVNTANAFRSAMAMIDHGTMDLLA